VEEFLTGVAAVNAAVVHQVLPIVQIFAEDDLTHPALQPLDIVI